MDKVTGGPMRGVFALGVMAIFVAAVTSASGARRGADDGGAPGVAAAKALVEVR